MAGLALAKRFHFGTGGRVTRSVQEGTKECSEMLRENSTHVEFTSVQLVCLICARNCLPLSSDVYSDTAQKVFCMVMTVHWSVVKVEACPGAP